MIRASIEADIPALQKVLDQTELFPSEMLPEMISGFLAGAGSDVWLTCETETGPCGFANAAPEPLADGTWNMLAIAVSPDAQGGGHGRALMSAVEAELKDQRVLIVDTSGEDAFAQTREFYRRNGYAEEARIRDYWAAGDDKIVFWKSLRSSV